MKAREIMNDIIGAEFTAAHTDTVDTLKFGDGEKEVKKIATCLCATPHIIVHGSGYHEVQYGPKYMWRKDGFKLVLNMPGKVPDALTRLDDIIGELYDLKNDPLEVNNLYDRREYFTLREQMTRQLLVHVMVALAKFPRGMTTTHV